MSGFVDLVEQAQPALIGGGVEAFVTEGRTWSWTFVDVTDNDGAPIDLTSVTGTCKVTESGNPVLTLTFTGRSGGFTVSADETATVNLVTAKQRTCDWSLYMVDAASSSSVQVWGPSNSKFIIHAE